MMDGCEINASLVEGIILDCGDVILHAPDHKWWPPPFIESTLQEWGISYNPDEIMPVMRKVSDLLDANHHMHTSTEAENGQFRKYFRVGLEMLGCHDPDDALIEELIGKQSDPGWYIVYDETEPVLSELKQRGYKLQMLSNSFRFLTDVMRIKGLDKYFDGMTISAYIGAMKPDDRIYRTAIDSLGLPERNILYVDDIARYVTKGIEFGMQGVVLDRFGSAASDGLYTVSSLEQLLTLL